MRRVPCGQRARYVRGNTTSTDIHVADRVRDKQKERSRKGDESTRPHAKTDADLRGGEVLDLADKLHALGVPHTLHFAHSPAYQESWATHAETYIYYIYINIYMYM